MCGCGQDTWCEGYCNCGCDHASVGGQARQAKHFALQYADMQERAGDTFKRGYTKGINDSWEVIDNKIDEYFHAVDFYQQAARQEVVNMLYGARESIAKLKDKR